MKRILETKNNEKERLIDWVVFFTPCRQYFSHKNHRKGLTQKLKLFQSTKRLFENIKWVKYVK